MEASAEAAKHAAEPVPAMAHAACGRTEAWPDNDARPELQTLRGRVMRGVLLYLLYGLWVVGVAGFIAMWLYSAVCIARFVWTAAQVGGWADATPPPSSVQLYLAFMLFYEAYHYVTRQSPHLWPALRHSSRAIFLHYPYFRLNVCVFEEREQAKQSQKQREDSNGDDTTSDEATDDAMDEQSANSGHLSAEQAIQAVEENDTTPYVESDDRALFAFHPHGVLTCGFAFNGAHHMAFERSNCRWLSADSLFSFPIMRDLLYCMEFASCAKSNMQRFMRRGQNLCILPGGFQEATLFERGKHRVYIKKRFGFIKLALQHGYKIYPAYNFGEEYTFHAFPSFLRLRLKLNDFGIPGTVFFGQFPCFYMPRNDVDLITVVGKPLHLPHIANPTREEVQKYHDHYVEALQELFDHYKGVYAVDPNATLEIY